MDLHNSTANLLVVIQNMIIAKVIAFQNLGSMMVKMTAQMAVMKESQVQLYSDQTAQLHVSHTKR